MSDIPVIKLSVESMRHQMLHYLRANHVELERLVDEEITRCLQNGDLEKSITDEVKRALPDHIRELVNRAMWKVRIDDDAMAAIVEVTKESLVKAMQRA